MALSLAWLPGCGVRSGRLGSGAAPQLGDSEFPANREFYVGDRFESHCVASQQNQQDTGDDIREKILWLKSKNTESSGKLKPKAEKVRKWSIDFDEILEAILESSEMKVSLFRPTISVPRNSANAAFAGA